MSFVDQSAHKNHKTAIIGVTAIHALIGTVLVTGLATHFIPVEDKGPLRTKEITEIEVPPPPPKPTPEVDEPLAPLVHIPRPPVDYSDDATKFASDPEPSNLTENNREVLPAGNEGAGPVPDPVSTPDPAPRFRPVSAKPSNNPGEWITTNDYRGSWVNRGWTGIAGVSVGVGANGRVQTCRITSSTGHDALDEATCKLVTRRARFDPARDNKGNEVNGNYRASVKWQLPR